MQKIISIGSNKGLLRFYLFFPAFFIAVSVFKG